MALHIIITLGLFVLLAASWAIGRFHISRVNPQEVGQLTPDHFTQRLVTYGTPLAALFGVLGVFNRVVDQLIGDVWFVASLAVTGIFAILVLIGSYLEAFWYRSPVLPAASRRRRVFASMCLPMLYSSLYLYWFGLIPAWFFLVAALLNMQPAPAP